MHIPYRAYSDATVVMTENALGIGLVGSRATQNVPSKSGNKFPRPSMVPFVLFFNSSQTELWLDFNLAPRFKAVFICKGDLSRAPAGSPPVVPLGSGGVRGGGGGGPPVILLASRGSPGGGGGPPGTFDVVGGVPGGGGGTEVVLLGGGGGPSGPLLDVGR